MAFSPYPDRAWVRVAETSKLLRCGAFKVPSAMELSQIQLTIIKVGTHGGSEQMRLKVYPSAAYDTPYATSSWITLASLPNLGSGGWTGWVPFTFSRQPLQATPIAYHVGLELSNYTRNGTTFFIGAKCDWPDPINGSSSHRRAAQMSITGYS